MNYQYRYGGTLKNSVKSLWNDGGFKRYYAGLGAAMSVHPVSESAELIHSFQGPLSRFGDTAANAGILALLESVQWPVLIKTIAASLASACFRMTLTPIDTLKTTQQTRGGKAGLQLLRERVKVNGVGCLWWGALATAAATFVGHCKCIKFSMSPDSRKQIHGSGRTTGFRMYCHHPIILSRSLP